MNQMEGETKFKEQKETARKNVLEELDSVALETLLEEEKSLTEDIKKTLETHYNDFYELLRKEDWESLNPIFVELTELMADHPQIKGIVIRIGMVPSVLSLLTDDISIPSDIQRNSLLMLVNLMHRSTEHVISLVELGIIPILFRCLKRDDKKLGGLELWALINISEEDDPKYRTEILGLGILPWIQKKFEGNRTQSFSGTHIALLVRNLLRFPLIVPVDEVLVILPILMNWINTDDFIRTSENALWGLASLCETQDERILKEIKNPTVVVKLCRILRGGAGAGREFNLIFPRLCDSLKGHKNSFLTTDQEDLETLKDLLHDKNELIRLKTCHLLSFLLNDIFGFRDEDEGSVLVHEIMPRIIDLASDDEVETREQATNCLFNFIPRWKFGGKDNVQYLVSQGLLTVLLANLADHNNSALVSKSLEAISEILFQGSDLQRDRTKPNPYAVLIEKSHFRSLLKDLTNHEEDTISDSVFDMLHLYFKNTTLYFY